MPKHLAVQLLRDHSGDIAASAFALACRLRPGLTAIAPEVGARSVEVVVAGVASFIDSGDEGPLIEHLSTLIRLRRAGGFNAVDFSVMSHCYLPTIRHACVSRAPSVAMGLAAFEVVESVVLPLIERLFQAAWSDVVADTTQPDGDPTETVIVPVMVRDLMRKQIL